MEEKYEPQNLYKWKYPRDYFGETFEGFYVFMSITRDADLLEESNWNCFLRDYPEGFDWDTNKGILIERASHWAVGWVDTIYIHESDYELLKICDKIKEALDNYPVYDDEDYSRREWEDQVDFVERELRFLAGKDFEIEEDISDEQFQKMTYWFCQEANSNEEFPTQEDFEELYERVFHTKECKTCEKLGKKYEYDDRHGFCDCQLKLFE